MRQELRQACGIGNTSIPTPKLSDLLVVPLTAGSGQCDPYGILCADCDPYVILCADCEVWNTAPLLRVGSESCRREPGHLRSVALNETRSVGGGVRAQRPQPVLLSLLHDKPAVSGCLRSHSCSALSVVTVNSSLLPWAITSFFMVSSNASVNISLVKCPPAY